jgi:hypothetical protein
MRTDTVAVAPVATAIGDVLMVLGTFFVVLGVLFVLVGLIALVRAGRQKSSDLLTEQKAPTDPVTAMIRAFVDVLTAFEKLIPALEGAPIWISAWAAGVILTIPGALLVLLGALIAGVFVDPGTAKVSL